MRAPSSTCTSWKWTVLSSVAECTFTGTKTPPNAIVPFHMERSFATPLGYPRGGSANALAARERAPVGSTGAHMDSPMQIRLFGAFAVQVGEQLVPEGAWRLRKGKSLVKLLALSPERRVHRERATEFLWPDRAAEAAANNFHQALYVARRALEAAGAEASNVLPLRDDMLMLYPGGAVEIDIDAFEAGVARARASGELQDYRAALDLHAGELLPEDRYEAWAADRREALAESHLGLLLEYSGRLREAGRGRAAIGVLEEAVVIDPLHEPAHRALMRLFAASGRRQQALAQYHRLRGALKRELEAEPDPQTANLYRTLLRGEASPEPAKQELSQPAPRSPREHPARPARHNLPIPL